MKFVTFCVGMILFLTSSIFSQAKVGTTGAQFLELSPSVQAIGMGEASAATTVHSSFYNNPAALGLIGLERKVSLSFFPVKAKFPADARLQNYELSFPLFTSSSGRSSQSISIGLYHTRLNSGEMIERDYNQVETGRTFIYNARATVLVCSYAYRGAFQFSAGLSSKAIKETAFEYSSTGSAFDLGVLFKFPVANSISKSTYNLFMAPSVGFALRNFGPDMKFIQNEYPLPQSKSIGLAYELGRRKYLDSGMTLDAMRILLAMDIEFGDENIGQYQFGTEISLYEFFNVRLGRYNLEDSHTNTLGFTFSTDRIGKFLILTNRGETSSRFLEFITERLNLEYNYARRSSASVEDISYHELVLSYHL